MTVTPLNFNRQIAGLRGIAATIVVFQHSRVPGFEGGYLGVDLFFVLSGFLITSSLLRARSTGGMYLAEFYWHRFLRLFPALALVCLALVVVSAGNRERVRDAIAAVTYIANWTRAFEIGVPAYLTHTWSLGVEEQFYVLWPVVLLPLLLVVNTRRMAMIAVALAVCVMVWRSYAAWQGYPGERIYTGSDFRADGLILGCALALVTFGDTAMTARLAASSQRLILPAIAILLMLFTWFGAQERSTLLFGYTMASACLFVVIAYFALPSRRLAPVDRLLGSALLVGLGNISYSLYIWHYPISIYVNTQTSLGLWGIPIIIAPSLLLAAASYRFVERPTRRLREIWPRRWAAGAGIVTLVFSLSAAAGGTWYFFQGNIRNSLFPNYKAEITAYGPMAVQAGVPFNVQPDGSSALWLRTNHPVTTAAQVRLGHVLLTTYVNGQFLAARVPLEILPESGAVELSLSDARQRTISNIVTISVTPAVGAPAQ